jgi:hypothetical protein
MTSLVVHACMLGLCWGRGRREVGLAGEQVRHVVGAGARLLWQVRRSMGSASPGTRSGVVFPQCLREDLQGRLKACNVSAGWERARSFTWLGLVGNIPCHWLAISEEGCEGQD